MFATEKTYQAYFSSYTNASHKSTNEKLKLPSIKVNTVLKYRQVIKYVKIFNIIILKKILITMK